MPTVDDQDHAPSIDQRGFIPVWLHAILEVALSFTGAFAGWFVAEWINTRLGLSGFWGFVVVAVCFFFGFNSPIMTFLKIVPARCRKCGGKSWGRFVSGRLTYTCARCGFVRVTRVAADD